MITSLCMRRGWSDQESSDNHASPHLCSLQAGFSFFDLGHELRLAHGRSTLASVCSRMHLQQLSLQAAHSLQLPGHLLL